MLNKRGKTILLVGVLFAIISIISILTIIHFSQAYTLGPNDYLYFDWLYHNESNLTANMVADYHCLWGNNTDTNKTCTPILEIRNDGKDAVNISNLNISFDVRNGTIPTYNKTNIVPTYNYQVSTTDSALVNVSLINETCINGSGGKRAEINCTINVSRIDWGDTFGSSYGSEVINPGDTIAIKLNWSVNKYYGGDINVSFEENRTNNTITIGPSFSSCGALNGPTTLNSNVYATGTCFTFSSDSFTVNCANYVVGYCLSSLGYGMDAASPNGDALTIENCDFLQRGSNINCRGLYYHSSPAPIGTNTILNNQFAIDDGSGFMMNDNNGLLLATDNSCVTIGGGGTPRRCFRSDDYSGGSTNITGITTDSGDVFLEQVEMEDMATATNYVSNLKLDASGTGFRILYGNSDATEIHVSNSDINTPDPNDIQNYQAATQVYFVNVSYGEDTFDTCTNYNYFGWWTDVYTKTASGPLGTVNVNIHDLNSYVTPQNFITNVNGWYYNAIGWQEMYQGDGGSGSTHTNLNPDIYTGSKAGYTNGVSSETITANRKSPNQVNITLVISTPPTITINVPISNNYYNTQSITYDVTLDQNGAWCGFSRDGTANVTMTQVTPTHWNYLQNSIPEGSHTWQVWCNSTGGAMATAGPRTFYVDVTNPVPSFGTNPIDNYLSSSSTITFDEKCTDNLAIQALRIYGSWGGWSSKDSVGATNNTWYNRTISSIPDGTWKWAVECDDRAGHSVYTANRTLTINTQTPTITIVSPLSLNWYNVNSIWFNVTTATSAVWCGYSLDGTANVTMSGGPTSWNNLNNSMTQNTHTVTFYCNNSVGFYTSNGPRTFYVDTIYPQLNNILPLNDSYFSVNQFNINFTLVEANPQIVPAKLMQWGRLSGVKTDYPIGCPGGLCSIDRTSLDNTNLTDPYVYYLFSNDSAGNINQTGIYFIHIDTVIPAPVFSSDNPANNTFSSSASLTVNVTLDNLEVSRGYDASHTYKLFWANGTIYNSTTIISSSQTVLTWTGMPEGKYYYNVTETNKAGINGTTETRVWTFDNTNPALDYITPPTPNNEEVGTRNIQIKINYTEANPATAFLNLTSLTSGQHVYMYNSSLISGSNNVTFSAFGLTYGNWTFYVYLNDSSGKSKTTGTRWVFVNATSPIVSLVSPANNYVSNITSVNFTCLATMAGSGKFSDLANISLYDNFTGTWQLDEAIQVSGSTAQVQFNKTLSENLYQWNCEACDTDDICEQYGENYTVIVDTTNPVISYSANSDTNGMYVRNWIFNNFTATDNLAGINDVIMFWNGTSYTKLLSQLSCDAISNGYYCYKNFSGLPDANYIVNGSASDLAGHSSSLASRAFQIDAVGPAITVSSPEEGETVNVNGNPPYLINVQYSIRDNVPLIDCEYNVTKQDGSVEVSQRPLSCSGSSFNFTVNTENSYYISIYANTSNHEAILNPPRYFIVSKSTGGGGGGGNNQTNQTQTIPICGDKICMRGTEDDINSAYYCQKDCATLSLDFLLQGDYWKWILIVGLIIFLIWLLLRNRKKRR